jgi:CHAT domain-containing protein
MLRKYGDTIQVTTLHQDEASLDNVVDALFSGVDIFHFIGHGSFNERNPVDSFLVLRGDREEFERLSVRTMSTLATSEGVGFFS